MQQLAGILNSDRIFAAWREMRNSTEKNRPQPTINLTDISTVSRLVYRLIVVFENLISAEK